MSIGYDSRVMIYNSLGGSLGSNLVWYGRELDHVRVELVHKITASTSGTVSAATCSIKIYDKDMGSVAAGAAEWAEDPEGLILLEPNTVFVIAQKADIGRNVSPPAGRIIDSDYDGGFLSYLAATYGMTYKASSAEHYSLIPHWVLNGS